MNLVKYPWEKPHLTKEFFRCKGNSLSPVITDKKAEKEPEHYHDCQGGEKHSLPLRNGQEFIYPCLIDILNYIQEKSQKKVVITCGHRCPQHNSYSDPTPANWGSKHMIGAEVDFYVESKEEKPEEIIALIQQFYRETEPYKNETDYQKFSRYHRENLNISTPPWYNKEIFIKLYLKGEGRDRDNQHPFPYICLQVRYDRDKDAPVLFDKKQAQNFLR